MTPEATTAEDRLAALGIHLPDMPTPFGAYVPAVQTGNLLFLGGMLATSGHTATVVGVLGKDLDVKAGREAAYTLHSMRLRSRRSSQVRWTAWATSRGSACTSPRQAEFTDHPKVADAASGLLRDVFGEETVSSRPVLGVASLPLGSPEELEVMLEVSP